MPTSTPAIEITSPSMYLVGLLAQESFIQS
jgi:hypothetical protein